MFTSITASVPSAVAPAALPRPRWQRALRLRLGRLQLELSLRRLGGGPAALSPELSDRELALIAQRSSVTYGASWERALAIQYGSRGNLPN